MAWFGASIADIRSPFQPTAAFLLEMTADLVAFMTGSTALFTDPQFSTYIFTSAFESVDTEVGRIVEAAFIPCIGIAVKFDLFGDGGRVLAENLSDGLERLSLIKISLDQQPVIKSEMFVVSRN